MPGLLATCAINKTVTLWDTYRNGEFSVELPPQACGNKDMNVGKLYSVSFYQSSPWLLGCGGSGKEIALWDMTRETAIQNRFGDRLHGGSPTTPTNENREQDFEAIMTANDTAMEKVRQNAEEKQKKNKKKKGKKKTPHRKRR